MAIKDPARKTLWSRAHDQCAFPDCLQTLTLDVTHEDGATTVKILGQEAHIRAQSPGGPRYDPTYQDVDGYENLMLLCPTHHTLIDADHGSGYTVDALIALKKRHESNQSRRAGLAATLRAYMGDRFVAEGSVQFQQVDLRGPSVDAMFVDVPVGYRRDGSNLATLLQKVARSAPGDTGGLESQSGLIITGAAQALLHPAWKGHAVLVGGPGQGKSTILQYVCQFHRARRLGEDGYTVGQADLVRMNAAPRFPIRIELRRYAEWAPQSQSEDPARSSKKKKGTKREDRTPGDNWRSLEEYVIENIQTHIGANKFTARDLALVLATEPVLFALDGLDEVASVPERERVVNEIKQMRGRLNADAADLVILIATRPGTSLQPLSSLSAFPVLHLQRLTPGLRLQYLRKWCEVAKLTAAETSKLQTTFMDSQNVAHTNELAAYPMQLAILLHLLYRRQLLPQQRTELYAEYLKTFLDREQGENKEPLLADQRRVIEETHAYLGWYLQTKAEEGRSAGSIKRDELRSLLQAYLSGRPRAQELADDVYSAITDRVLCLVEREDAFEFEVQSLREYFAAIHIFDNLTPKGSGNSRDDGLNSLLERPYWANVCRFFIGKLSRGELRGLIGNFRCVEKHVAPQPLVRAMAATLLNDRVFDQLISTERREIVDFVLDGPGIVLAEDGVLDPAGTPFRFGTGAGREEAVNHLQSRILGTEPGTLRTLLEQSLVAHADAKDDLAAWWWNQFAPTGTWLQTAAHLKILSGLTTDQVSRLREAIADQDTAPEWHTELLLNGGYDGTDESIAQTIIEELNQGAAESTSRQEAATEVGVLASCAAEVLAGPFAVFRLSVAENSRLSAPVARILEDRLSRRSDHDEMDTDSAWLEYLSRIANSWGTGWVLRRVMSMVPDTADLSLIALGAPCAPLTLALQNEAAYREHRSDASWWQETLDHETNQVGLALNIIAALETARTGVIIAIADDLDTAVSRVDHRTYHVIERALQRDSSTHRARPLDLSEALRLQQISISGRSLWLVWLIGSDSTRERIPARLEPTLRDVFSAGTLNGRSVLEAAKPSRKLKIDTFDGARASMPIGGWVDSARLATMTLKAAQTILEAPARWPADLAQIAAAKFDERAAGRNVPLSEVATKNHWFER